MMSQKKYLVTLTSDERDHLNDLLGKGKASALVLTHARIPLKADPAEGGPGWLDEHIAEARDVSAATVERVRQRFVGQGLEPALGRKEPDEPRRARARRGRRGPPDRPGRLEGPTRAGGLDPGEAGGRAGRVDLPGGGPAGAPKNELEPRRKGPRCIPPEASAACACALEDVLEVYRRPFDEERPQVCSDEASAPRDGPRRIPPRCCGGGPRTRTRKPRRSCW